MAHIRRQAITSTNADLSIGQIYVNFLSKYKLFSSFSRFSHYNDVTISTMVFKITRNSTLSTTVCQSSMTTSKSMLLIFCYRGPVDPPRWNIHIWYIISIITFPHMRCFVSNKNMQVLGFIVNTCQMLLRVDTENWDCYDANFADNVDTGYCRYIPNGFVIRHWWHQWR